MRALLQNEKFICLCQWASEIVELLSPGILPALLEEFMFNTNSTSPATHISICWYVGNWYSGMPGISQKTFWECAGKLGLWGCLGKWRKSILRMQSQWRRHELDHGGCSFYCASPSLFPQTSPVSPISSTFPECFPDIPISHTGSAFQNAFFSFTLDIPNFH